VANAKEYTPTLDKQEEAAPKNHTICVAKLDDAVEFMWYLKIGCRFI
jgi:hypothetical protein